MKIKWRLGQFFAPVSLISAVSLLSGCDQTFPPVDYTDKENWLCYASSSAESKSSSICDDNMDAIVVNSDGTSTIEAHVKAIEPEFDCFYAYPTASLDLKGNADLKDGVGENAISFVQVARYSSECRVFAPVYRQTTLATIFTDLTGNREVAYNDVKDAFDHYLKNENNGRGFILVGHSQGASLLRRLISETVETTPALREKLISAHLMGSTVSVPIGAEIGGAFQTIPACRTADDFQCVVSFASYRDTDPFITSQELVFGRPGENTEALCTNPALLAGGKMELDAYLPIEVPEVFNLVIIQQGNNPYQNPDDFPEVTTPFYKLPGFFSGECVTSGFGNNYLEITANVDPLDPRTDNFSGEFLGGDGWGLHLVDINLALGNLVDLARSQYTAWKGAQNSQ